MSDIWSMATQKQEIERVKSKIYQATKRYKVSVRNNEPLRFRKHIPLLIRELELELLAARVIVKK